MTLPILGSADWVLAGIGFLTCQAALWRYRNQILRAYYGVFLLIDGAMFLAPLFWNAMDNVQLAASEMPPSSIIGPLIIITLAGGGLLAMFGLLDSKEPPRGKPM